MKFYVQMSDGTGFTVPSQSRDEIYRAIKDGGEHRFTEVMVEGKGPIAVNVDQIAWIKPMS